MEKKLKAFLDNAFKPYGNFPARKDVEQELLARRVVRCEPRQDGRRNERPHLVLVRDAVKGQIARVGGRECLERMKHAVRARHEHRRTPLPSELGQRTILGVAEQVGRPTHERRRRAIDRAECGALRDTGFAQARGRERGADGAGNRGADGTEPR